MWYFEQAGMDGTWQPVTAAAKPITKHGRMVKSVGVGSRIRAIREVPEHLHHLTLDQLRELFSPDGKFAAENGVKREADHAELNNS